MTYFAVNEEALLPSTGPDHLTCWIMLLSC